jgi:tetratricopeptide (TPR) repeat protein
MEEGLNYLQTFNPGESKPELLEQTLIGRKDLVRRLEELIIESARSGNKHQRLMIGPRGSGKTHTLKVLYNRIRNKKELQKDLDIAYLCEDEYGVATFLDLILRILRSFIRWYPERCAYLKTEIEKLKKVNKDDQENVAKEILLKHIKGKTLLIIVENIGNIFHNKHGFGKKGQQKFRDLLQQNPNFTIMSSNQALFLDIQREDMPFHNFFKIIHLWKISIDETFELMKSIAEWDKNSKLFHFLNTPEGKGRVIAIYEFTGGNHRLIVTFYHFLKTDYINKLSETFIKTVNDLIPFYQSMMSILSAQQQKIVQFLSQNRKPATVKTIAENCFSAENTISKQMSNLLRLRYVDDIRSGRETYYEISETLFRICNEVKENRGGPIKLFVDFLGILYTAEEIKRKYMHYHILTKTSDEGLHKDFYQEQSYYKEALKFYYPRVLEQQKIKSFEQAAQDFQIKTYIDELEQVKAYSEIIKFTSNIQQKDKYVMLKKAIAFGKTGDVDKKIATAKLLLKEDKSDIDALFLIAESMQQKDNYKKSDFYYQKILNINSYNLAALNGLGNNLLHQNKYSEAEQLCLKILLLNPNNKTAIENMGIAVSNQGDYKKAQTYFKKLNELNPDYSDGWRLLGFAQEKLKEIEKAEHCYLKAIELDNENSDAIENLGILYYNKGDYRKAHNDFKKLTKLNPDYSDGWRLLGLAQEKLKEIEKAENSYLKAIELDNENSDAIEQLGILYFNQGDFQKAHDHFKKLTKLNPDYSNGWVLLGMAQENLKETENAENSYLKAIELDNKNSNAIEKLGLLYGNRREHQKAHDHFKKLTKLNPDHSNGWVVLGMAQEKLKEIEKAENSYLKAIELDNENSNAIEKLGLLYGNRREHQKAHDHFKKLTKLNPEYSEGWRLLGQAQEELKIIENAENSYLKAIELDGKNSIAIEQIGILYGVQGEYQKAHDCFKKLTELNHEYSDGWRLLGQAQEELKENEKAENSYLKAIELDGKNSDAVEKLGILYGNQDDFEKAHDYLNKLIEISPNYSVGWWLLGLLQENLNEIKQAKISYQKAFDLDNKNVFAIVNIGSILFKEKKFEEAESYFQKALKEKLDNSYLLNTIGEAYRETALFEKAIPIYEKAIKADPKSYHPYFNIVSCLIGLNRHPEALIQLQLSLKLANEIKVSDEIIQVFEENVTTLLITCSTQNISNYLSKALTLIEKNTYIEQFYKSIPATIFVILKEHKNIDNERMAFIENLLNEVLKEKEEMSIPLKLFNIGIRHLKKKEKNVMMELTKEERTTFKKFVLDKITQK